MDNIFKIYRKALAMALGEKGTFILRASSSALTAFSSWKRLIFCARLVAASCCPPDNAAPSKAASCSWLSTL